MRSTLALGAAGLTAIAALVSQLDGDPYPRLFFLVLTGAALACAAILARPSSNRIVVARLIGALWIVAAAWVGALLLLFGLLFPGDGPVPPPPATYLGLTATTVHLVAMSGATALIVVAAFGRSTRLDRGVGQSPNLG